MPAHGLSYSGKAYVRGGPHHVPGGAVENLYDAGAVRNIATFYEAVTGRANGKRVRAAGSRERPRQHPRARSHRPPDDGDDGRHPEGEPAAPGGSRGAPGIIDRRAFLASTAVAGLAAAAGATTASSEGTLEVATNTYR